MVAGKPADKLVTIVALREFKIESYVKDAQGTIVEDNSKMTKVGEVLKVSESQARDLCKPLKGAYAFSGERYLADGDVKHHDLTRARRAVKRDLVSEGFVDDLDQEA